MLSNILQWKKKNARWINRYTITLFCFLVWMTLFDRHNIFDQAYLCNTVERLKTEKANYNNGVEETKQLLEEIYTDVESFARETYYMHRSDEEVFVFIEK